MKLIEVYAKDLGVKIGKPIFKPHFFPSVDGKYITVHNGNKVPSKEYSYWKDVLSIVSPELKKRGIQIYQIGLPEEPQIPGVDKKINTGTLKQLGFLIQHSLLHVGIDSVPVHLASALDVPSVSLYAHTYANTCDPVWNKNSVATIIESDRGGKKPSFSLQEEPKTVDMIMPEKIAKAIFEHLSIEPDEERETLYVGRQYNSSCMDVVLKEPITISLPNNSVIRMDLYHDEHNLETLFSVQENQVLVKTSKPINTKLLEVYKDKLVGISYFADKFDEKFVNEIRKIGIPLFLSCTNFGELKGQRLKFLDFEVNYFNEKDLIDTKKKEISEKATGDIKFNSGKFYLIGQKKVVNLIDVKKICGLKSSQDDFYVDSDHMMIYKTIRK